MDSPCIFDCIIKITKAHPLQLRIGKCKAAPKVGGTEAHADSEQAFENSQEGFEASDRNLGGARAFGDPFTRIA